MRSIDFVLWFWTFYFRMVCTDAVARGMDLGVVDCVISYDPPKFVKNHIHRIGRTARAGKQGTAITLLTDREVISFLISTRLEFTPNFSALERLRGSKSWLSTRRRRTWLRWTYRRKNSKSTKTNSAPLCRHSRRQSSKKRRSKQWRVIRPVARKDSVRNQPNRRWTARKIRNLDADSSSHRKSDSYRCFIPTNNKVKLMKTVYLLTTRMIQKQRLPIINS